MASIGMYTCHRLYYVHKSCMVKYGKVGYGKHASFAKIIAAWCFKVKLMMLVRPGSRLAKMSICKKHSTTKYPHCHMCILFSLIHC